MPGTDEGLKPWLDCTTNQGMQTFIGGILPGEEVQYVQL